MSFMLEERTTSANVKIVLNLYIYILASVRLDQTRIKPGTVVNRFIVVYD